MPALENPRHEQFCQLATVNSFADAWRAVFGQNPQGGKIGTMYTDLWKFTGRPEIAHRIEEIQAETAKPIKEAREWILRWWFLRMTYNPAEIIAWAVHACRYCHGDGHGYQWREGEFFEACDQAERNGEPLPDIAGGFGYDTRKAPHEDCPRCDGRGVGRSDIADTRELSPAARAAFEGIKQTRDGIEVRMADKNKAAEQFAKLSGFDVQTVRHIAEVPTDAEMAVLAQDPMAAAAAYKRLMTGTLQ